jgi:hypothetical protein
MTSTSKRSIPTSGSRSSSKTSDATAYGFTPSYADVAAKLEAAAATLATPVCDRCDDTHAMTLGDQRVACTGCPVPCEACRSRGRGVGPGAFCATTPCTCPCHIGKLGGAHAEALIRHVSQDSPAAAGALAALASSSERTRGSQPVPPAPRADLAFGCRTFSATLHREREFLGDTVTVFLDRLRRAGGLLTDYQVRQSSDMGHHCLSIILFYQAPQAFVRA